MPGHVPAGSRRLSTVQPCLVRPWGRSGRGSRLLGSGSKWRDSCTRAPVPPCRLSRASCCVERALVFQHPCAGRRQAHGRCTTFGRLFKSGTCWASFRSNSSRASRLNINTRILVGSWCSSSTKYCTRCTIVVVLPEPAMASTHAWLPKGWWMIVCCSSVSDSLMSFFQYRIVGSRVTILGGISNASQSLFRSSQP